MCVRLSVHSNDSKIHAENEQSARNITTSSRPSSTLSTYTSTAAAARAKAIAAHPHAGGKKPPLEKLSETTGAPATMAARPSDTTVSRCRSGVRMRLILRDPKHEGAALDFFLQEPRIVR